jgi:hypothetical protein
MSHDLLPRPASVQTAGLCRPGGYSESVERPITYCLIMQQLKPLRCGSTVVTVRMSGVTTPLSRPATEQTAGLCRPGGYCESVGRLIISSHVPQLFKPLGCVALVVTVKVSGVPSPLLTSHISSNRLAVSPRWLL